MPSHSRSYSFGWRRMAVPSNYIYLQPKPSHHIRPHHATSYDWVGSILIGWDSQAIALFGVCKNDVIYCAVRNSIVRGVQRNEVGGVSESYDFGNEAGRHAAGLCLIRWASSRACRERMSTYLDNCSCIVRIDIEQNYGNIQCYVSTICDYCWIFWTNKDVYTICCWLEYVESHT